MCVSSLHECVTNLEFKVVSLSKTEPNCSINLEFWRGIPGPFSKQYLQKIQEISTNSVGFAKKHQDPVPF